MSFFTLSVLWGRHDVPSALESPVGHFCREGSQVVILSANQPCETLYLTPLLDSYLTHLRIKVENRHLVVYKLKRNQGT
jgi:hypothetical protein